MSHRVLGVRRGNSVQERIQNPVATIPQLRLIPTTDVVDKAIIVVEDEGSIYRFDYERSDPDNGSTIIKPDVGPGRWIWVAGGTGGGPTGSVDTDQFVFKFAPVHSKAVLELQYAQVDLDVVAILLYVPTTPTSAGIYDLKVRGNGNDLLNTSPENLKGYAGGTFHSLTLTTVDPAFLELSVGDILEVEVESDDADLFSRGVQVWIIYETQAAAGLPPVSGQQYSVLMEDPAGVPVFQCLRQSWICPDFYISGFSLVGGSFIELGDTLTNPSFTASYSLPPTVVSVQDDQGGASLDVSSTPTAFIYAGVYTKTTYGNTVTWSMNANDASQADVSAAIAKWVQRLYYGVAALPGAINETFVEGLSNNPLADTKTRTFTETAGALDYIWYCYRSAYGPATFTVGGFTGGFTLVATIPITNAFGVLETYYVYRSDNIALGTTTVEVS